MSDILSQFKALKLNGMAEFNAELQALGTNQRHYHDQFVVFRME